MTAEPNYDGSTVTWCGNCADSGFVCENHPDRPWAGMVGGAECCGGAGMPCPECCDPVPEGGTIGDAFMPRHLRGKP